MRSREELLQRAEECERLADLSRMEAVQRALRVAAGVCRRLAVTNTPGRVLPEIEALDTKLH